METQETPYHTLARWEVKPGEEEAFVAAWKAMGAAFAAVPGSPALEGTLLQSLEEPTTYYSFGGWPDLASIKRMRAHPPAQEAMRRLVSLCTAASPGAYALVARLATPPGPPLGEAPETPQA